MPRLDGTGPEGRGPRTGRGIGNCNSRPRDFTNYTDEEFPRRMFGYRRGRRGRRRF